MNGPDPNQDKAESARRLAEALRRLQSERLFVPPAADEAVLTAARRHFERLHKIRSRWRDWKSWTSLAASLLFGAWLVHTWVISDRTTNNSRRILAGDMDGNGVVDILDAFALARSINNGASPPVQFDLNGDGSVDRLDVDRLAMQAVALGKEAL